ncbi:MAG TPA: TPM domain-containing protein [Bacteroidales bacterium]|nr:TPM domain-containing protein [Bacteroidales bacterium]
MKFLIKLFLLFFACIAVQAQEFPEKPNPPKAVNDFAGFLSGQEQANIESALRSFYDTTKISIVIVVVPSLHGYETNDYATRLYNKWGIGDASGEGKDNGVLILVKPKTAEERGQAYILEGYGVEGFLPDVVCKRIVENEMLPRLRENKNFEAIAASVNVIFNLSKGNYTAQQYMKSSGGQKKKTNNIFIIIGIIAAVLLFSSFGSKGGKNLGSKGDLPLWILLSLLNSGGGRGSFGGFSSGGGGFGGFGGGRSGGGGAGGSW